LEASRKPRPRPDDAPTVADVVNAFLTEKKNRVDAGELSARMWSDYYAASEAVVEEFGRGRAVADLRPDDFANLRAKVAGRLGPASVLNFVTRLRVLFKFAYDFGLIDVPVRYGSGFDRPPKKVLRLERARKGLRLAPAADLRKLIDAADRQLRAMILLGLNGGLGATDCSELPRSALALRPGWLDHVRPKTGVTRRFLLWSETAEALESVHRHRPDARDPADADKVFLTRYGVPWVRFIPGEDGKQTVVDSMTRQFTKLAAPGGSSELWVGAGTPRAETATAGRITGVSGSLAEWPWPMRTRMLKWHLTTGAGTPSAERSTSGLLKAASGI
jgi:integrase